MTPVVPSATAANAGGFVMYWRVASLAARHRVTLAAFAQADDAPAIACLQRLGVDVHGVPWQQPANWRRWPRRLRLASEWLVGQEPLRALEFRQPRMHELVNGLLAAQAFDVLHVESAFRAPLAAYRCASEIPSLLIEHEVALIPARQNALRCQGALKRHAYRAEWRRWRNYELTTWPGFDRIQAVTDEDAEVIRQTLPAVADNVRVNPVGLEAAPSATGIDEEANSIVFVGSFEHQPNVDAALWLGRDILPQLRATRPGVRVAIVGENPPSAVRALAGADTMVTGRVPAVEPYIDRAAVVVAPIRLGGGMRIKVLQAMARGKAIVSTRLGARGLAVDGAEPPLVLSETPRQFASSIACLLGNDPQRRTLGEQARQFVATHHTWASHMQRLEQTYREIVPQAGRA